MSLAASHGTIRRIRRSSLSAATAREKDDFPITLSGPPSPPQRRTASTQGQHLPSDPGRPAAPIDYAPAGVPAASGGVALPTDRKSTRLNSSHHSISYAVFCLKKKK